MDRRLMLGLPLAGLALLAACTESTPMDPVAAPAFAVGATGSPVWGYFTVCKVGTAASFEVTVDGGAPTTWNLADGDCEDVYQVPAPGSHTVTVTELSDPSYTLNHIVVDNVTHQGTPGGADVYDLGNVGTNPVTATVNGDKGTVATFYNDPVIQNALGRMTGGGNPEINGVNFGLTLHCDITLSNNLEVNWDGGNWHLDKPITSALCIDDPAINPVPPAAGFDTFIGDAIGRLDGVDGSYINFTFVDAGEPGRNDMVSIQIWAPGADPATDPPVLDISGNLTHGNLQAHHDQPHGDHG